MAQNEGTLADRTEPVPVSLHYESDGQPPGCPFFNAVLHDRRERIPPVGEIGWLSGEDERAWRPLSYFLRLGIR